MTDDLIRDLALRAGVDPVWRDQTGQDNATPIETLRAVLGAIGLPCGSDEDARNSLSVVEIGLTGAALSRFLSARVGQPVVLPVPASAAGTIEVELESGAVRVVSALDASEGLVTLPPFETPGYHRIRTSDTEFDIAVAPTRCVTFGDLCGDAAAWGLAAQIYSLRRRGDGGIGDFEAAADVGAAAGRRGADFLAISPVHALFAAEPRHFSPYSPSNRLCYNPLHAAPSAALPAELIQAAIAETGIGDAMGRLEALDRIDWPEAGKLRATLLRALFDRLMDPANRQEPWRHDFERFRNQAPASMRDHCTFEALHAQHLQRETHVWSWTDWAPEFQDPKSAEVLAFQHRNARAIDFHLFCQWLASRSYGDAQRRCRDSGMRVGLIADLAIGMERTGSHAWSRRQEVLNGIAIGAPPDYYNMHGQNWGLTGFSPRGLAATGFAHFIETLRATMRHAGGIRIDHVMGISRLWVVPDGANAADGAYLHFPSETMFRLIALESWRHKAIVIGEDLGTLPYGFRTYLREQGIAGLRVLPFERDAHGFNNPEHWDDQAVAMTTTHDLVPTAGWWAGTDLGADDTLDDRSRADRDWNRGVLWSAFVRAGVAGDARPAPEDPEPVVNAAIAFVARTPGRAKLLALEDALALAIQPNVPGTTEEKPNWSHRLKGDALYLLDDPAVEARLQLIGARPLGGAAQ